MLHTAEVISTQQQDSEVITLLLEVWNLFLILFFLHSLK